MCGQVCGEWELGTGGVRASCFAPSLKLKSTSNSQTKWREDSFRGDWGLSISSIGIVVESTDKNKQGLQEDGNESSTTVVCRSLVVVVVVVLVDS